MAKVTVISGGAGGIGIPTARRFAKTTDVLVADLQAERIEIAKKELKDFSNIVYMQADTSKLEDVQAMGAKVKEMGQLQNVVHASAISEYFRGERVEAIQCVKNNILSTMNMGKVFIPMLTKGCSYVNVASMTSHYHPLENFIDAFKAAMDGDFKPLISNGSHYGGEMSTTDAYNRSKAFTRWYSMSNIDIVSEKGARINTVSPGIIRTPMPLGIEEFMPGVISGFAYGCPVEGRMGEPDEAAELIEFLSNATYINGTDVLIDGGILGHIRTEQFTE